MSIYLGWEAEAAVEARMSERLKVDLVSNLILLKVAHVESVIQNLQCLLDIKGYDLNGVSSLLETLVEDVSSGLDWRSLRREVTKSWGLGEGLLVEHTDEDSDVSYKVVERDCD